MSTTGTIENAAGGTSVPSLPGGAWDIISALSNAKDWGTIAGGAFITLLGLAVVIVGIVFLVKKLIGNGNGGNEKGWLLIIAMIVVGGALLYGGINLVLNIAEGGKTTVEELGGGFAVIGGYLGR